MDSFTNVLITVLAVMGGIRAVFGPIIMIVNKAIATSPSKEDDAKWNKIKSSWWFLAIQYTLDFTAGLKIKPPEEKKE